MTLPTTLLDLAVIFARDQLQKWKTPLYKSGFLVALIYLFNSIWQSTATPYPLEKLLLYLIFCEAVLLSVGPIHRNLYEKIRSDELPVWLLDPTNIVTALRIESLVSYIFHFISLFVLGAIAASALVPSFWSAFDTVALSMILLGFFSGWLLIGIYSWLGLLTHWIGQPGPVALVLQKLCIILGGVLAPLSFYSELSQRIFEKTPFAAAFYNVGKGFLSGTTPGPFEIFLLLGYIVIVEIVIITTTRRLRVSNGV